MWVSPNRILGEFKGFWILRNCWEFPKHMFDFKGIEMDGIIIREGIGGCLKVVVLESIQVLESVEVETNHKETKGRRELHSNRIGKVRFWVELFPFDFSLQFL
ncbi:unnamed protein product [Cuscuta epithymum]|uniref:Uncharacterized protein n=1 Tax=Cuscuta epithymum TaxID=186058 RepID=A0AAV0DT26_9ASTE|nr:unnamed protein product [Cuscuta epithymum]